MISLRKLKFEIDLNSLSWSLQIRSTVKTCCQKRIINFTRLVILILPILLKFDNLYLNWSDFRSISCKLNDSNMFFICFFFFLGCHILMYPGRECLKLATFLTFENNPIKFALLQKKNICWLRFILIYTCLMDHT